MSSALNGDAGSRQAVDKHSMQRGEAVRVKKKVSTVRRARQGGRSSLLSLICFWASLRQMHGWQGRAQRQQQQPPDQHLLTARPSSSSSSSGSSKSSTCGQGEEDVLYSPGRAALRPVKPVEFDLF